jgi:hypothetical protein
MPDLNKAIERVESALKEEKYVGCRFNLMKLSMGLHAERLLREINEGQITVKLEDNEMTLPLGEKDRIIIIPKRELDELKIRKAKRYAKKPLQVLAWQTDEKLYIQTLEGVMKANKGDYIIQGVKGEYYPCKPDVFKETYEEVQVLEKLREVP